MSRRRTNPDAISQILTGKKVTPGAILLGALAVYIIFFSYPTPTHPATTGT